MRTALARLFRSSRSTGAKRTVNRLGRLESLESRLAPAVIEWSGLGDLNNFEDAENWASGGITPTVPGPFDDAVIGAAFATQAIYTTTAHTLHSLNCKAGSFTVTGGKFELTATFPLKSTIDHLFIASGAMFPLTNNLESGDVTVFGGGTLDVKSASTLTDLTIYGGDLTGTGYLTVDKLTINDGTVTGTGDLTVSDELIWTGGALRPGGKLIVAAGAEGSLSNILYLGRVLENNGDINYAGSSFPGYSGLRFGPVAGETGTVNNMVGASFTEDGNVGFSAFTPGPHTFNNFGTFTHNHGTMTTGNSGFTIPLVNTGTLNSTGGVLAFHFASSSGTINVTGGELSFYESNDVSGPINVSAGANVDVDFGTLTLSGGAVVTGAGSLRVAYGHLNVADSTSATNIELQDYYDPNEVSITGAGDLSISGTFTWSGSTLNKGGKLILLPGSTGLLSGDMFLGRVLENNGTIIVSNSVYGLDLNFGAAADEPGTINNLAGASFTVDSAGLYDRFVQNAGTGNAFNNAGTFTHLGVGGETVIQDGIAFHNTGTINVSAGTLTLFDTADSNGPIMLGGGANLVVGNSLTLTAGTSVSGTGTLVVGGGTLAVAVSVTVPNFSVAGGMLTGAGNVTISDGFTWTFGTLRPGGKLILDTGSTTTMPFSGPRNLGRVLENRGTVNHSAEFFTYGASPAEPGTINNLAGATYTVHTYADFYTPPGGPGAFNNAGTFTFDDLYGAGSVTFRIPFTNTGTANILAGTMVNQSTITTSGTVTIAAGTDLVTTSSNYVQTAGTTTVNGSLDPAGIIDIKGGTVRGTGTLMSKTTNAGTVSPGMSPGKLTVDGNYVQTGALAIEINGATAGTLYDQLVVNGTVTLGGSLTGSLGYAPAAGASFVIIANDGTDAVSGTFAGLAEGAVTTIGGRPFAISYKGGTGNDVTLTLKPVTVASVVINGGDAQRSRVTSVAMNFDQHLTISFSLADAFVVTRQGGGQPNLVTNVDDSGATTVVTLTFLGINAVEYGSLADGRYTLSIDASKVSNANGPLDGDGNGIGGDNYVLASDPVGMPPTNIFRLFGDATGDGTVAIDDFNLFRSAFGGPSDAFDYDGDGSVAISDFNVFRNQFGATI